MNNVTPMVREVDKIIANLLIAEGAVVIPEVGALRVVRRAAKRISSRQVEPPYRTVEFLSQTEGTSLVEAIACAAGCTEAQAREICRRWVEQVSHEGQLLIGGVGQLREKSFLLDEEFDRRLNPRGHEPVTVRRRGGHGILWTLAAVAIVCGIGACGWIFFDRAGRYEAPITVVLQESVAPSADADTVSVSEQAAVAVTEGSPTSVAASTAGTSDPVPSGAADEGRRTASAAGAASTATSVAMEPQRLVSGRTYVVFGVYSTLENARRAVKEATRTEAAFEASIYRYGSKFMVSVYASDQPEEAAAFVRRHASTWPDIWSYRAR